MGLTQINHDTTAIAKAQTIACVKCNKDHFLEAGVPALRFHSATVADGSLHHEHGLDGLFLHSSHLQDLGCEWPVKHFGFYLAMSLDDARSI